MDNYYKMREFQKGFGAEPQPRDPQIEPVQARAEAAYDPVVNDQLSKYQDLESKASKLRGLLLTGGIVQEDIAKAEAMLKDIDAQKAAIQQENVAYKQKVYGFPKLENTLKPK